MIDDAGLEAYEAVPREAGGTWDLMHQCQCLWILGRSLNRLCTERIVQGACMGYLLYLLATLPARRRVPNGSAAGWR